MGNNSQSNYGNLLQPLFDAGESVIKLLLKKKVPNEVPYVKQIYKSNTIAFSIGKKDKYNDVWIYFNQTPHLLITSTTGFGKSVCLKSILTSIITNYKIDLYCIDFKIVELSLFANISKENVYDIPNAIELLDNILNQCLERYEYMKNIGITDLNNDPNKRYKPIILVVEEMVMLLEDKKKECMSKLKRILGIGRGCMCYCILTCQKPSNDLIDVFIRSQCAFICFHMQDKNNYKLLGINENIELRSKGQGIFKSENGEVEFKGFYITDEQVKQFIKPFEMVNKPNHSTAHTIHTRGSKSVTTTLNEYSPNLGNSNIEDLSFLDNIK